MLSAARLYAEENVLTNIDFIETDVYQSDLPLESFNLIHARFMFAPLGRDDILLNKMIALTRPGGVVASQEWDEIRLCFIPLSSPGSGSNSSPLMRLREAVEITAPDGALMAYSAVPVWRMCKPEPLAWLCLQDTLTELADQSALAFRPRFWNGDK